MIDLHTHILPGLDDGARNAEIAREQLRMEAVEGVKTLVFTPHFYGKRRTPESFIEKRAKAFDAIRAYIPENMQTRLAAEVYFSGVNMPETETLCRLAIENTKYILFELPFTTAWSQSIMEQISDFIAETDYTPIIAHVERYEEVRKNPALLSELADMGCLLQVNAQAFTNKREHGLALAMLRRGFVHCLGTDTHDVEGRAPDFTSARRIVERKGGNAAWLRAQEIMQAVLADERVKPSHDGSVRKFFGSYR